MSRPNDTGDAIGGLILALRGLALVAAGSALWQWPVGPAFLAVLLDVVAVPVFVLGGLALIVAAAGWRNAAFRQLKFGQALPAGTMRNVALTLPFLAGLAALAALVFLLVGRILS